MAESTLFTDLVNLYEALESTTKRNEKKRLIADFLLKLREDEVQPAVAFTVGETFSEADQRVLEVGGQTIWRIMDIEKQTALIQKPLTILDVMYYFEKIASVKGEGSRRKKD